MGYGEWLAVPLFAIACQNSLLWRRRSDRPAGRLRFISPPPTTRHDIIGILRFGAAGRLSGERIYASDDLLRFMFGPLLGEASLHDRRG